METTPRMYQLMNGRARDRLSIVHTEWECYHTSAGTRMGHASRAAARCIILGQHIFTVVNVARGPWCAHMPILGKRFFKISEFSSNPDTSRGGVSLAILIFPLEKAFCICIRLVTAVYLTGVAFSNLACLLHRTCTVI